MKPTAATSLLTMTSLLVAGCLGGGNGVSAHAAAHATLLDGVYRMTDTAKELASLDHIPAAQEDPSNYGDSVIVFDRRRFAETTENKLACVWAYGTLAVTGHVMAWRFRGGGGLGTQGFNRPGEFFKFTWSTYRDTLTLSPVKGATSPTPLLVNPWDRLSPVPSARYFSKRCPPPKQAVR
jgi:hypothetical protein